MTYQPGDHVLLLNDVNNQHAFDQGVVHEHSALGLFVTFPDTPPEGHDWLSEDDVRLLYRYDGDRLTVPVPEGLRVDTSLGLTQLARSFPREAVGEAQGYRLLYVEDDGPTGRLATFELV